MTAPEPTTVVTLGPSGVDHYYEAAEWPALGGKAMLGAHETAYGGMIANTACVLGALGVRTRHVERIGADGAEGVLASLRVHGVDTDLVQVSRTARTCVAYVVRVGGERSILIDDGGREPVEFDEATVAALDGATAIVTSLAELREPGTRRAVRQAIEHGARVALDIEPAGLADRELDRESALSATWLCADAVSLAWLGLDVIELARGREVAVVDGARGSTVHSDDRVVPLPALPVAAVDTTGCSDTYLAAYLCARLRGDDIADAGAFATVAAARAATGVGPRHGATSIDDIESFARAARA